jgi:isopentenyl-diphosphate Delta-isomerase
MSDYYIDIVNEKDEVIGGELKSKKHEKGFISRVVAIYLIDSENKFLMCKRASRKDDAAGLWDLAACGNVESGESYGEAAKRELDEELDIDCRLEMMGKFYEEVEATKGGIMKVFCGVFVGFSDKIPKLNHELSEFKKMSFEEIETELKLNPKKFCHGFRIDFEKSKKKLIALIPKIPS